MDRNNSPLLLSFTRFTLRMYLLDANETETSMEDIGLIKSYTLTHVCCIKF